MDDTSSTWTSLHSTECVMEMVSLLSAEARFSINVLGIMTVRMGTQPARTRSTILGSDRRGRPSDGFSSAAINRHILRIVTLAPTCAQTTRCQHAPRGCTF